MMHRVDQPIWGKRTSGIEWLTRRNAQKWRENAASRTEDCLTLLIGHQRDEREYL